MDQSKAVQVQEKERIYHFPLGDKVVLQNVVEVIVRDSGTHRIKTADEKLHIVSSGWLHIEINEKEWTF